MNIRTHKMIDMILDSVKKNRTDGKKKSPTAATTAEKAKATST